MRKLKEFQNIENELREYFQYDEIMKVLEIKIKYIKSIKGNNKAALQEVQEKIDYMNKIKSKYDLVLSSLLDANELEFIKLVYRDNMSYYNCENIIKQIYNTYTNNMQVIKNYGVTTKRMILSKLNECIGA